VKYPRKRQEDHFWHGVVVARAAAAIELSGEEERELRAVLRTPSASQQQALRGRIVLRAADGVTNTQIAEEAGVSLPTVGLWRTKLPVTAS